MNRISLTFGGLSREYLLFAPGRRTPLVTFLHGMGGTAVWADGETGWSQLAAREGFALVIPDAIPPDPTQPPKFLTNPPRWNDGATRHEAGKTLDRGDSRKIQKQEENEAPNLLASRDPSLKAFTLPSSRDDVGFLAAVLDDVALRLETDLARTFLTGFSNGAAMAFRFAAERAERIAAIAPIAGHCWLPDPKPVRPVPTLYVLGSADPLIPLHGGDVRSPWQHRLVRRPPVTETLERWARAIRCDTTPKPESDVGGVRMDTYPGPVLYRTVLVEGLGHHWPGGKGQLNHRIAGPPSDAVDGTKLVWEFFKRFV